MDNLFIELLQVAVGSRKSLSRMPSAREWGELYTMAAKQALTGVCFVGLQRLNPTDGTHSTDPEQAGLPTQNLPKTLKLHWLGMAAKIQQRNRAVTEECVKLCRKLELDGFVCCVLKGQSNLEYYPEHLNGARTPGDIDVLLRHKDDLGSIALPIRYCLRQAAIRGKRTHVTYHHADLFWEGQTEVEAHYRATFLCSPVRNWRLQKTLCDFSFFSYSIDSRRDNSGQVLGEGGFPVPSVSFNAVYQLLHMFKHMFEGGIGLRQLLDYYFVLKALHLSSHREVMHSLSHFGMKKFAGAVMYVLQAVFDMADEYLICKPNVKEGRFLLNEVMMAGNFGQYDERIKREPPSIYEWKVPLQLWHAIEKIKHNLRLLKHYPEEVLWEPVFRIYHFFWRRLCLWKW